MEKGGEQDKSHHIDVNGGPPGKKGNKMSKGKMRGAGSGEKNVKQQEMVEYGNKENCKPTTWREMELYNSEGDEFMAGSNSIDKNKI